MLTLHKDSVKGIDNALDARLVLSARLSVTSNLRIVKIYDPREEGEIRVKALGWSDSVTLDESLKYASQSFTTNGERTSIRLLSTTLESPSQSLSDRILTAGGSIRAYRMDDKTHLTVKGYRGSVEQMFASDKGFYDALLMCEEHLDTETGKRLLRNLFSHVPDFERHNYQTPPFFVAS
jgi:hypothetical protein